MQSFSGWCCSTHLALGETETHFGTVNHPSKVLHINTAFLPAAGRVVMERRIPFYVLYGPQVFGGHFLQATTTSVKHISSKISESSKRSLEIQIPGDHEVTLKGVTVLRMFMMLLDFSCPSWGFFRRNRRLLLRTERFNLLQLSAQVLTPDFLLSADWHVCKYIVSHQVKDAGLLSYKSIKVLSFCPYHSSSRHGLENSQVLCLW